VWSISSTSFGWKEVMLMLSSVTGNGLKCSIVSMDRNVKSDNGIASPDKIKVILGNTCLSSGSVEEKFDLF
jgi:hypothetical protein